MHCNSWQTDSWRKTEQKKGKRKKTMRTTQWFSLESMDDLSSSARAARMWFFWGILVNANWGLSSSLPGSQYDTCVSCHLSRVRFNVSTFPQTYSQRAATGKTPPERLTYTLPAFLPPQLLLPRIPPSVASHPDHSNTTKEPWQEISHISTAGKKGFL